MEALIRLYGCTSKSSLGAYDILFLFLCCSSDYCVVYTINGRICRLLCKSERERERERERESERETLVLFTKGCYSCFTEKVETERERDRERERERCYSFSTRVNMSQKRVL